MFNQDFKEMGPLLAALGIAVLVVLLIDLGLLIRWVLYLRRRDRAIARYGYVYDSPLPEGTTFTASSAGENQTAVAVPLAPAMPTLDIGGEEIPYQRTAGESREAEHTYTETDTETEGTQAETVTRSADVPLDEPPVYLAPYARSWSLVHPFLGLQFVVVGATALIVLPLLLITMIMASSGRLQSASSAAMDSVMLGTTVLGLFLQNALFVLVTAFFLRRYGTSLRNIGLDKFPKRREVLLGVGLGLALFLAASVVEFGLDRLLHSVLPSGTLAALKKMGESFEAGKMFRELPGFGWRLTMFLAGALAAPLGEEVFFRGFVYNALRIRLNVPLAIVLSGLVFALIHVSPLGVVVIFPMGMLLAYVYERTKSLWVTTIIHAMNNGLAFLLLWLFPGSGN